MNGPAWKVINQAEIMGQDASGRYVQGVRVSFTTRGGHTGSVFVPDAQYSDQAARVAIEARAAALDSVGALEG